MKISIKINAQSAKPTIQSPPAYNVKSFFVHTAYKVSTIVIPAVNAAAAIHVVAGYIEQMKDTKNDSQSVNNRSKI